MADEDRSRNSGTKLEQLLGWEPDPFDVDPMPLDHLRIVDTRRCDYDRRVDVDPLPGHHYRLITRDITVRSHR